MYNFTTEFWKTAGNTASVPVTATDQPALKQIHSFTGETAPFLIFSILFLYKFIKKLTKKKPQYFQEKNAYKSSSACFAQI